MLTIYPAIMETIQQSLTEISSADENLHPSLTKVYIGSKIKGQ